MPVMVIVIGLVAATPLAGAINSIRVPDAICAIDGVMDGVMEVTLAAVTLAAATLWDAPIVNTNTSDGNIIWIFSPVANACEIFIVIVKGPLGFVHTAELPWEEIVPPEDAHLPFAASHVVPISQHPGP